MAKKLVAEFFGTLVLVFVACGVATVTLGTWAVGSTGGVWGHNAGILITALAFGLTLAGLAYAIGPVSGCHVNPAVTVGMLVAKRIAVTDAIGYIVAQFVGALAGAALLLLTFEASPLYHKAKDGLGADGYGSASMIHISAGGAFLVEAVLTAIFVFVILGVTTKTAHAATAGLIIGLTLVLVHLFGIPVTGTSVNPARSFGPAVLLGGQAVKQLWLFIVAPVVGGIVAALLHVYFRGADA